MNQDQRKQAKLLTDVDHYFTLREPCVASLRSDRHQIGMTDRHHRNAHAGLDLFERLMDLGAYEVDTVLREVDRKIM